MHHQQANLFIGAWVCLLLGAGIVSATDGLVFGLTIAIAGVVMFFLAYTQPVIEKPLSEKEVAVWAPASEAMPSVGGKAMYRIDTTIDDPIRTSILCGACGELEWVEGLRPPQWNCPACSIQLWDIESEEE